MLTEQLENLLLQFDRAWREGHAPRIRDWLENVPAEHQAELLEELIKIDVEYQWKAKCNKTVDDYLEEFPQLSGGNLAELIEAELEARGIVNLLPADDEIQSRFATNDDLRELVRDYLVRAESKKKGDSTAGPFSSQTNQATLANGADRDASTDTVKTSAAELAELTPNTQIDHYVLNERIGQGSFATVWKATDTRLRRVVAIKVLKPDRQIDAKYAERFLREARAAAMIDHPNVVRVHEVIEHGNTSLIVSNYVNGPTLADYVASQRISQKRAAEIVRDIAAGLHAAHQRGVIHRDVKPANILMDGERPMIADFGMAHIDRQHEATITKHGDIMGTPTFMSPEQARGDTHIDGRTDVYSLGAILYQLLAGRVPFDGSVASVIHDVIYSAPPPLRRVQNQIDHDLETITLKCLQKDAADRYQAAAQLANDLQRFINGEPIEARPVSPQERLWKWVRRRPRIAGLLAGILLLGGFLLGTILQLQSVSTQRDRAEQAETQYQNLLAIASADAGRLAMQRGQMHRAVDNFATSLTLGIEQPDAVRLDLIEALLAIRDVSTANIQFQRIDPANLNSLDLGRSALWQAELAMEPSLIGNGDPVMLYQAALQSDLSDADRAYVEAMLADSTLKSIEKLTGALELEPLRYRVRRNLVLLLISLARFEEADRHLRIGLQMFPADIDLGLLKCMLLAAQGESKESMTQLESLGLPEPEFQRWQSGMDVVTLASRLSHDDNAGALGFDQHGFRDLINRFRDDLHPCLVSRNFRFPPVIAEAFIRFDEALGDFQKGYSDDREIAAALDDLTVIHPEASMLVLFGGKMIGLDELDDALSVARQAINNHGFVEDTDAMAVEMAAVVAAVMFQKGIAEDPAECLRQFVDAIERFEDFPGLVDKYRNHRGSDVFLGTSTVAMQQELATPELVDRWIERYESFDGCDRHMVPWIRMIVAQNQEDWIEVLRLCDLMLEMDPNDQYGKPNEEVHGARTHAIDMIREITNLKVEEHSSDRE